MHGAVTTWGPGKGRQGHLLWLSGPAEQGVMGWPPASCRDSWDGALVWQRRERQAQRDGELCVSRPACALLPRLFPGWGTGLLSLSPGPRMTQSTGFEGLAGSSEYRDKVAWVACTPWG